MHSVLHKLDYNIIPSSPNIRHEPFIISDIPKSATVMAAAKSATVIKTNLSTADIAELGIRTPVHIRTFRMEASTTVPLGF